MRQMRWWSMALAVAACTSTGTTATTNATVDAGSAADVSGSGTGAAADGTTADTSGGLCEAAEVACTDNQIQDLSLFKKVNAAAVDNVADGSVWTSKIDATAGGMTPTKSFVYAKFTATGLEPVEISDEQALDSQDWDIAFRRYVIRLNSGVSGPSCVQGGEIAGAKFDEVTTWPQGQKLAAEKYYDTACKIVEDASGLPMAPKTVLSKFWSYASCVQMTGKVYGLQLGDGQHVKLTVDGYYDEAAQTACNDKGSTPPGSPGGKIRVRWAMLP